jgi:predicted permease
VVLRRVAVRLRALFRRSVTDRELDEELELHVDRAIARNVARGMSEQQARHAAHREFGNVTAITEAARDAWRWQWIEQARQDVRYALRAMRRRPAFTAVAVASIALGSGAAVALFAVIDSTLLRPLPVRNPAQLVASHGGSYPLYQRFRELRQVLSDVAAVSLLDRSNVIAGDATLDVDRGLVRVELVSGNYFAMLGVKPAIGRTLSLNDDRTPGGHPVAVISDGYWRRRFGSAPNIVGRTLGLNGTTYTVIGVVARGFTGETIGRPVDVWLPIMMQSQVMLEMPGLLERNNGWLHIIGRLQPGVTVAQAQAAVQATYRENEMEFAGSQATPQFIESLRRDPFLLVPIEHGYSRSRDTLERSLGILLAIVGMVFVIACANVGGLQLARAEARGREMAIRVAIGAARARLIRQLLTESVVMATIGGALGVVIAVAATALLSTTVSVGPVQMDARAPSSWLSLDVHPRARTYLVAVGISLVTGVLFGIAPAFRGSSIRLAPSLIGRGSASSSGPRSARLGRSFVVAQVALAFVLVIVTSLFVRTVTRLRAEPLGVDGAHLLLVWTAPGQAGRSGERLPDFVRAVLDSVSRIPGVMSANGTNHGVLEGEDGGSASELLNVPGLAPRPGLTVMRVGVTPGFFTTVGMAVVEGRDLNERDVIGTPRVALINEAMSQFFFGGASPIGRQVGSGDAQVEIVGVVKDAKHGTPRDRRGIWYVNYRQYPGLMRNLCIVVRTSGDPTAVVESVRRVLRQVDPLLPILRVDTVKEQLDDALAQERAIASLSLGFGSFAVLLACIGLYGVVANGVTRRTNEIGIRMALGASRRSVVTMVVFDVTRIVLAGLAVGVPLTIVAQAMIASRLYDVAVSDRATIAVAMLTLAIVTGIAGLVPAYRAARIDPNIALRYD